MSTQRSWTAEEQQVLAEARAKLNRRMNRHAMIAIAGLTLTVLSFVVGQGVGVVFVGAIIAGPLYALQDQRNLKQLDRLEPGTPLHHHTLGVRTSSDPPPPSQKRAAIIVGSMIGIVLVAIVVMFVAYG